MPGVAPLPNVSEVTRAATALDPATVARFRNDLARTLDIARDTMLVAVSGGADSLALVLLGHAVLGARCRAATVDHGLRPAAASEARLVARVCAERGIGHQILAGPLPARASRTANVSARARILRYDLLAAAAGDSWIATAHHADDQLETMIMRLNRGAGVAGLAGIRRAGDRLVRPLLEWRHAELTALVAASGIVAIDDPSNRDDRFDRARLRKLLHGVDWLDAERIGASAAALGDAEDALAWSARRLADDRCSSAADTISLDPTDLPFELERRLVLVCLQGLAPAAVFRGGMVAALVRTLRHGSDGTLGGVRVTVDAPPRYTFALAPPRRGT